MPIRDLDPKLRRIIRSALADIEKFDKYKYDKISPSDLVEVKIEYYSDNIKIDSPQLGRDLFYRGLARRKVTLYAKEDIPTIGVSKGDVIEPEQYHSLKEYTMVHNAAVTLTEKYDIPYNEAFERVMEAKLLYEAGLIDSQDYHEMVSP